MRGPGRSISADDRGFTLPELLVATVLGLLVIGAAVTAFTSTIQSQPRINSQAAAIQQARTTMEQITRELRRGRACRAHQPPSSRWSPTSTARPAGAQSRTRRSAVASAIRAPAGPALASRPSPTEPGPGPPVQVVAGLSSDNVFAYTPPSATSPAYVGVTLALPARGGSDAITLSDGAALRNPGSGS